MVSLTHLRVNMQSDIFGSRFKNKTIHMLTATYLACLLLFFLREL